MLEQHLPLARKVELDTFRAMVYPRRPAWGRGRRQKVPAPTLDKLPPCRIEALLFRPGVEDGGGGFHSRMLSPPSLSCVLKGRRGCCSGGRG